MSYQDGCPTCEVVKVLEEIVRPISELIEKAGNEDYCGAPGPKGDTCHLVEEHLGNWHESSRRMWDRNWKPNPSRTTYRTDF